MAKKKSPPKGYPRPAAPPRGEPKSFRLQPETVQLMEELAAYYCIGQTAVVEMCVKRVHRVEIGDGKKPEKIPKEPPKKT